MFDKWSSDDLSDMKCVVLMHQTLMLWWNNVSHFIGNFIFWDKRWGHYTGTFKWSVVMIWNIKIIPLC